MSSMAVLEGTDRSVSLESARAVLAAAPERGTLVSVWHEPGVVIAVAAHAWEFPPGDRSPPTPMGHRLAVGDRWVLAADASLFPSRAEPTAQAILAMLECEGPGFIRGLRADFAIVAYERATRRVWAARDYEGKRALFVARCGRATALSSTIRGLERLPWLDRALNLVALAEDAANVDLAVAEETVYRGVARLPAGHEVWLDPAGAEVRSRRWWEPPVFESGPALPFNDAAESLRELLVDACGVRSESSGTAVWLSGGYDSTAVFGATAEHARRTGGPLPAAVSLSHPLGDEGREDHYIEATTSRWGATPTWREIASVPGIDDPRGRAAARDEPFSHPYELWNRALARASADCGARIAFSGNGGDQFFSVSPLYFADLVRRLRWGSIPREFRDRFGHWHWRSFFRLGIQPLLRPGLLELAGTVRRGPPLRHYLYRRIPVWVRRDFARSSGLEERRNLRPPRRPGEGHSAWEHGWHLRAPFGERVDAMQFQFALSEGVEMRSPLYDESVIRLASTRPREESNSRGENKHLLRAAARPLLPDEVTAARQKRTGLPSTYFRRSIREMLTWHLRSATGESRLSGLGIVDDAVWRQRAESWLGGQDEDLEEACAAVYTAQAELWLASK